MSVTVECLGGACDILSLTRFLLFFLCLSLSCFLSRFVASQNGLVLRWACTCQTCGSRVCVVCVCEGGRDRSGRGRRKEKGDQRFVSVCLVHTMHMFFVTQNSSNNYKTLQLPYKAFENCQIWEIRPEIFLSLLQGLPLVQFHRKQWSTQHRTPIVHIVINNKQTKQRSER